jgi:transposase
LTPPPDDHECGWRTIAEEMQAQLAAMQGQLDALKRQIHGKKSEKRPPSKLPPSVPSPKPSPEETQERRRAAREQRDAQIVVETSTIPVPRDRCVCPSCGATELGVVGEGKESSVIEYVQGHFRKRRYLRETRSCACGQHIVTAPAPDRIGEGTRYAPSFVAHLVVSKCADSAAQYRLEKAFGRLGIPMARSTMNDLVHRAADEARPIWLRMCTRVAASSHVAADETTIAMRGKSTKAYMWTFLTDALTLYVFATGRSGATPQALLGGSHGSLLCDAYTGYNQVSKPGHRTRAGCNAHARRKVFEASEVDEAAAALDLYRQIYEVEREAKERGIVGTAAHLKLRRERSRSLFARLLLWARGAAKGNGPRTKLGKAANYLLNNFRELGRFLRDPKLAPDNNRAEAALRRVALGRKTFLFVGGKRGGENLAILYSLVTSCEQNGKNPLAYLTDVLLRVADHPASKIDELLPDRWQPPDRAG